MKLNLEDIDQLIKETLTEEESLFYDSLEEQNIFISIFGLYLGKNGWLMIIMSIVQVLFFGLFVYSAIEFFNTDVTNELIRWGVIGIVCMIASAMLKIYGWMRIEQKSTVREIKRIELLLSAKSGKSQD
jgi:K+-sensing histidine kinase KdpD